MNTHFYENLDDLEEASEEALNMVNHKANQQRKKGQALLKQKGNQQLVKNFNPVNEKDYPFTYHASQHEKEWLLSSVSELYEQNWFEDILAMVRGGKEASVYLCRTPPNMEKALLAAKVYRPRRFRNLKKDHLYREGRDQLDATGKVILDDRAHHAMYKKTSFGLELLHSSWVGHEFLTMQILADAGVDLPRPYVSSNNAIMMDYIGDEHNAAPALNEINLTPGEARPLFQRVIHNIELMLACNRVHADLSAYNILYWEGEITLIDFPQAINPEENHNAWRIFARDVLRVCEYFTSQGVACDANALATKMWKSRGRATQPEIDPHYLDPEKDEDLLAWRKQ
jgi:RIO kinase 1